MTDLAITLLSIAAVALGIQIWTTTRVWRSELFSRGNKVSQAKLVWMLPLVGSLVVLCAHYEIAKEEAPAKAADTQAADGDAEPTL